MISDSIHVYEYIIIDFNLSQIHEESDCYGRDAMSSIVEAKSFMKRAVAR